MKDAQRPKRYYVAKAFICAAIVLQIVHLFLNFRAAMSLELLLRGISLAVVVAFQIAFMGFAGIETRAVAICYAISEVWTTCLWLFLNIYRAPGAGIDASPAGFGLPAYMAALFEALVFVVITLSFTGVIKGRKTLAAAAVAAKLAIFLAFAANAALGTNWAFATEFIKGDSALITYIQTGQYAGGPDIERFFEIVFTCLALLGYLAFFTSFHGDQHREDPYGIVNTKGMVLVSAISLGAAQLCWIDRMIAKLNALTGARRRSALKEILCIVFIPLYFIYWVISRDKIARKEGLKLGYALPNRGAASAVLSIFTLGIAGSALLQSNLNRIAADSHEFMYDEEIEPDEYAEHETYGELPGYDPEYHDDSMFRPENRQYADEAPDEHPEAQSPEILPSDSILPPDSMAYDDTAYSESPTLQYPYVGLPARQQPKVSLEQPHVFSPDEIRREAPPIEPPVRYPPEDIKRETESQPKEPAIRYPAEDTKREPAFMPGSGQPREPDRGMSVTEASHRLEGLKSVMEAIRELSELKSEGLITDEEFSKTKLELLSRL